MLIWFLLLLHAPTQAAQVTQVNDKRVVIVVDDEEDEIKPNDYYYLISPTGKRRGLVLVTQIIESEVWANLVKGEAEAGWTLKYRGPTNPFDKNAKKESNNSAEASASPVETMNGVPITEEEKPRIRRTFNEDWQFYVDFLELITLRVIPHLEMRLGQNFSVGLVGTYINYDIGFFDTTYTGYGLSWQYAFKDFVSSGVYAGGTLQNMNIKVKVNFLISAQDDESGFVSNWRAGYRWVGESGGYVGVGANAWISSIKDFDDDGSGFELKYLAGSGVMPELVFGFVF